MKFNELIDLKVNISVAELIQLFLLGYDDKIYLNLKDLKELSDIDGEDFTLQDERILSDKWIPYYEYKIKFLEDTYDFERSILTVVIDTEEY